jgi:hypothetical protein
MKVLHLSPVRALIWFIKIAIVIAAGCYIYEKIVGRADLGDFTNHLSQALQTHSLDFTIGFLLLFLNWGIEAWKWKILLGKIMEINYWRAFRSVMAGITTGIFTPNRVGEFGGRVFDLEEGHRTEAALLSFAGGLLQLLVTVLVAVPAVFACSTCDVYLRKHMEISLVLALLMLLLLFLVWFFRDRLLPRASILMRTFRLYPAGHWLKIFGWSLVRYGVFTLQFVLLLRGFGVAIDMSNLLPAIALVFFATTVIPTFAISEIGVRGSVSVVFIGMYSSEPTAILASSFLLWIINIAIPAVAGGIFVLRMNPFKSKNRI